MATINVGESYTKSTTVGRSYDSLKFTFTLKVTLNSQDVETNTSNITIAMLMRCGKNTGSTQWNTSASTPTASIYLGDTELNKLGVKTYDASTSDNVMVTWSGNVNHATDGTYSLTAKSIWTRVNSFKYVPYTNTIESETIELATIPRATTPTLSSGNVTLGNSVTITLPRASEAFTHNLTYTFGETTGTIGTNYGTSATWTPPKSLASEIPSATSGTCTITCKTYNGTTLIGTKSVTCTLSVSNDIVPTISSIATSEGGSVHIGVFVQNYSKIIVDVTSSGSYGSTIKSIVTTFDGVTYTGASFTSGIQYVSGTKDISVTVTDSRNRTATSSASVTILAYTPPKIIAFDAIRCDATGEAQDDGRYAKITYKYSTSALNNQNQISLKIASGETSFIDQSPVAYNADTYLITGAIFDTETSYDVTMTLTDEFNSNTASVSIATDRTIFDVLASGKGIAFGKVAEEEDLFDVGYNARFNGDVEFANDTNWTNLTLSSTFTYYDSNVGNTPKYKVWGKMVEIKGTITPVTTHTSSNTRETIATLPSALAPSEAIYQLCQGTGKNIWLFSIQTDGEITFSRYGTTANTDVPSGAWLPFHITYLLD